MTQVNIDTETKPLYKVLVNGRSCHGGNMEWSLPTKTKAGNTKPGKWHTYEGDIVICATGLHFTTDWQKWLRPNCTVYNAEATGVVAHDDDGAKCVARRGRLLSEVKKPEWWTRTENAIVNLTNIAWLKPTEPKPEWRIFYGKDFGDCGLDGASHRTLTFWHQGDKGFARTHAQMLLQMAAERIKLAQRTFVDGG